MAWNEPGDKQQDSWKKKPKGTSDIDDTLNQLIKQIKSIFGGSGSSGSDFSNGIFYLIVFFGLLSTLFNAVNIIDESEKGVVLRFGAYHRTQEPGLNFHIPLVEKVHKVNVQLVRTKQLKSHMLTQDENIIELDMEVQYRIKSARNYLFNVNFPDNVLLQSSESAIRDIVGNNKMDYILSEGRTEIAADAKKSLEAILDRYQTGQAITSLNLEDIRPPQQVKGAFDDVINAREDSQSIINKAQAYANSIIPETRGQAARLTQEAEAYKRSIIDKAEGEAQRFDLLYQEYKQAPQVTRSRLYIDAMQNVFSNTSKVILDAQNSNNLLYLPLEKLLEKQKIIDTTQESNMRRIEQDIESSDTTTIDNNSTGRRSRLKNDTLRRRLRDK